MTAHEIAGDVTRRSVIQWTGALLPAAQFQPIYGANAIGSSEAAGWGGMAAANRTELAAIAGGRAYLAEPKRAGNFIFDNANHAAKVAADTRQALFVAPASDATGASGAWVRQFDGAVNVKWFGATGDGTTDDGAAFTAALALLKQLAINDDAYYKGSAKLLVPAGHYYLGTTTLDITHTLIIEGESGIGGGISTLMRWADNTTGIRVQGHNTNGAAGTDPAPFHFSGAGSHIRNISLRGGFSGTEGEYHGIHVRAGCTIENFWIDNFPGDGIFAHTTATGGGADEGNSNGMAVRRGRITNVRDGFGIDGADANVWLVEGVDVTYARRWGVWDSSFLGNTYINVHVANAGLVPGNPPTIVHYLGNRFFVKVGQAAGASTNAPPATATDNAFWGCMGAGGEALFANIPTWTSGMAVREGGGFKTDSPNARNQLIGCYTEGGQAPSQLIAPTLVIGGLWGADIVNTDPAKDMATILAGDGTSKFPLKAEFSDLRTGPLGLMVNGLKVVGTQGTSLPADATDLASALALINSIKARLVAHGLVAK